MLLSFLVNLQQALSSGYINSVITTIEKRFEIPSSLSGLIASSYEIGNVITVIFVSYLGSTRHIPVWIAIGKYLLSLLFFFFFSFRVLYVLLLLLPLLLHSSFINLNFRGCDYGCGLNDFYGTSFYLGFFLKFSSA